MVPRNCNHRQFKNVVNLFESADIKEDQRSCSTHDHKHVAAIRACADDYRCIGKEPTVPGGFSSS